MSDDSVRCHITTWHLHSEVKCWACKQIFFNTLSNWQSFDSIFCALRFIQKILRKEHMVMFNMRERLKCKFYRNIHVTSTNAMPKITCLPTVIWMVHFQHLLGWVAVAREDEVLRQANSAEPFTFATDALARGIVTRSQNERYAQCNTNAPLMTSPCLCVCQSVCLCLSLCRCQCVYHLERRRSVTQRTTTAFTAQAATVRLRPRVSFAVQQSVHFEC